MCYHTPPTQAGNDPTSIVDLNSDFSFSLTKSKEKSLLYYLPILEGRRKGSMSFERPLMLMET